jgi:phosphatidate cytidylyltransferase
MSETYADLLTLFLAVLGLLVLANVSAEMLRARTKTGRSNSVVETYLTRVHSWWAMVTMLGLSLVLGPTALIILLAFCSFAALREFLTLTRKTKADHWALVASFYVILPAQFILVSLGQTGLFTILIPVYAFLLLPILSVLRGGGRRFLERISETQWALMTCVYCASHVPALLTLQIHGYGERTILLIAFLIMVVQLGDLMDYFAGRRFGKHVISPDVSPKTWEGLACGLGFAMIVAMLLSWITPFGPLPAALMGAAAYLAGTGGALVLAAVKADRGIKNWGHLIPGQGGFVDQLDSVFFAAPVFFHLTRYFWG